MTRYLRNALACLCACVAPAATPPPALAMPAYRTTVLGNGLTLLLMEQHEVPFVSLSVVVKPGSVADPEGKAGVAEITAALLRKGTATRSAEQFAEELDRLGGSFEAGAACDASVVSAEFLTTTVDQGLALVADALLRPAFTTSEVAKCVAQHVDGIKAAKDTPDAVIGCYFDAYLFGKHPYARPAGGDERSLAGITREDVATFYTTHYTPDHTIMAAVGDFDADELADKLAGQFGGWPSRAAPAADVQEALSVKESRLLLVDNPGATQTHVCIGNVGINDTHPDRAVVDIVNTIFGGRFTSRLNSQLRVSSGLTYSISSSFAEMQARGPFSIATYTDNKNLGQVMRLTLDALRRLHGKGITEDELASAKAYIKGHFPLSLESSDELASLLTSLAGRGLDRREVDTYCDRIGQATLDDVKRIIKQYFPEDALVFVLIGDAAEIEPVARKYARHPDRKSINEAGF